MSLTSVLYDERVTEISNAKVEAEHLWLKPEDLRAATGWKLETEGLCKGDTCVRTQAAWVDAAGLVDLSAFAQYLGQPITREDSLSAWAFGESVNARRDALFSLEGTRFHPARSGWQAALTGRLSWPESFSLFLGFLLRL